jgi:predicted O-linked N-acetylglucosamine transferase (SPINDLY family)
MACGLPIVTLPGRFMRGRQSAAMLRLADAPECVASDEADYVRIACALLGDRAAGDPLRLRLRAGENRIFNDPRPLRALAEALHSVLAR